MIQQTESYEIFTNFLCKLALTFEIIDLHFFRPRFTMFITIPALLFGWLNSISLRAITETLGTEVTNNAIFGNNTCALI